MSQVDRVTRRRSWVATRDWYARMLREADRLLAGERDPAMLIAGCSVRDELRQGHRHAIKRVGEFSRPGVSP